MPYTSSGEAAVWWDSTGEGTAVLLISGLSSPSATWFRLVPFLAARHRTLTFDNLGAGRTKAPSVPYTVPMLAGAAAAVIDAAGESTIHVLGISMGGLIAQELALTHPHLVSSLTLVSTHAGAPHMSSDQGGLDAIVKAADLPPEERARQLVELIYATSTPREQIEEDLAVREQYPASEDGYRNQTAGTIEWERLDELQGIACPTLVLHGDQDRLVSLKNSRQLVDHIPNAHLTVLTDCGHELFTDQPAKGASTVLKFLASVDRQSR